MAKRKSKKSFGGVANLCLALSFLLGVATFVMTFFAGIQIDLSITKLNVSFPEIFFGSSESFGSATLQLHKGAILPFIAYIVVFVSALLIVLAAAMKKASFVKLFAFVCGALMIAGGIVILCTPSIFASVNELGDSFKITQNTIGLISGILAICGGVLSVFSLIANKLFK